MIQSHGAVNIEGCISKSMCNYMPGKEPEGIKIELPICCKFEVCRMLLQHTCAGTGEYWRGSHTVYEVISLVCEDI
jgi:hypothetical protein